MTHKILPLILSSNMLLYACGDKDTDTSAEEADTDSDTDTDTDTDTDADADCADTDYADSVSCTEWLINTTATAPVIGSGTLTDVQSATVVTVDGVDYLRLQASGIPSYSTEVDQALVDELNSRPHADTDFVSGETTITAGQTVLFGEDVGYSSNTSCGAGAGYGYWPPGPECPADVGHDQYIPLSPSEAASGSACETGLGWSGSWVNGVSIFNWGDGFAYDSDGVWLNIAGEQEVFDLDICSGHAAQEEYHHHGYSRCLADALGDTGTGHSPVYGIAADGYPIHGPWHASGVAAESCWVARDYDDASDPYGCGGTGERSCVMVDPFDPSQGTVAVSSQGPTTSETVTSLSGNTFPASDGLFYQDYYYDSACAARGGAYLDAHNGHDHDDYGYHYHVTSSFPHTMGPTLRGTIQAETSVNCDGVSAGGGPPR